jgi:hypothetical protein
MDAAPTDPEHPGLPVQWQIVMAIDYRFALRRLAAPAMGAGSASAFSL